MYKLIIVHNNGNVVQSSFEGHHAEDASDYYFKKEVEGLGRSTILYAVTINYLNKVRQHYVAP